MAVDKQLILLLGMHRSGTSAVTRMLNLLGADLGNDLLAAQAGINDQGFWENRELVEINERILKSLSSAWYDFSPYPADWWKEPRFEHHKKQVQSFIDSTFSFSELSALKDPRLCRLLPLWLDALRYSGKQLKALLVLRHPDEVVNSMCKRDPFTRETAYLLWAIYVMESEIGSRELPRSIIQYQTVLDDWQGCSERIAEDLDLNWHGLNQANIEKINNEINPALKHNIASETGSEDRIEKLCNSAWRMLTSENIDIDQIDQVWEELKSLVDKCEEVSRTAFKSNKKALAISQDLTRQIEERDSTIQDKLKQLEAIGRQHQQALDVIEERDEQLQSLGSLHEHALDVVQERDTQLESLNKQLEAAGQAIDLRNRQLENLLSNTLIRALNKTLKLTDIE